MPAGDGEDRGGGECREEENAEEEVDGAVSSVVIFGIRDFHCGYGSRFP